MMKFKEFWLQISDLFYKNTGKNFWLQSLSFNEKKTLCVFQIVKLNTKLKHLKLLTITS